MVVRQSNCRRAVVQLATSDGYKRESKELNRIEEREREERRVNSDTAFQELEINYRPDAICTLHVTQALAVIK